MSSKARQALDQSKQMKLKFNSNRRSITPIDLYDENWRAVTAATKPRNGSFSPRAPKRTLTRPANRRRRGGLIDAERRTDRRRKTNGFDAKKFSWYSLGASKSKSSPIYFHLSNQSLTFKKGTYVKPHELLVFTHRPHRQPARENK